MTIKNLTLRQRLLASHIAVVVMVLAVCAVLIVALGRPEKSTSAAEHKAEHLTELIEQAARVAEDSARILELADLGSPSFRSGLVKQNVGSHKMVFGSALAFLPEFQPPGPIKAPYAYRSGNKILLTDLREAYDFTLGSQWFIEPVRVRQPRWSTPYFDDGGGNIWMITYSVPIFRGETVLGVMTIDIAIDELAAANGDGKTELLGPKGKPLNQLNEELSGPALPIGHTGISMRWQGPEQQRNLWAYLASLLVCLGLALLAMRLLIRVHTKPLYSLAWGFRQLQKGKPTLPLVPHGAPELKELAVSFNRLQGGAQISDKATIASAFIEHLPGVAYRADSNGHIQFINPYIFDLTGFGEDEFIKGERLLLSLVHSDDQARVQETIDEAIKRRVPYAVEYRLEHRLGSQRWVAERGDPVIGDDGQLLGWDGAIFDIADKQSARERLERREQLLTAIFKEVPTGLAMVSEDGKVVESNPALAELLGLSGSQLKGALVSAFFRPKDMHFIRGQLELLQKGEGDFTWEGELISAQGKGRWVQLAWRSLSLGRSVLVVTDMDTRRAMEKQIQEAKEEADHASKAKSDFLANMSHEIRTPMNAILGFAQLAQEQEGASPYLGKIQQASKTLLRILNDILDFSKIEAGKMSIENVAFRLDDTLANLRDIFADTAAQKHIELVLNLMPDCPNQLKGDPHRLTQILMNLVSNALKFTEKGEIVIGVQQSKPGWLQFSVRDTGIGMTPDQISRLFGAFSQADSSTTRRYGGTGLGLAICQRLCQLMGGEIEVRSEFGRGTLFSFSLPLVPEGSQSDLTQVAALQGCQALVVDDNETQLAVLEGLLSAYGFVVRSALDGSSALQMMSQSMPQLLLVDWQMPGMDGIELIEKVKALPTQPKAMLMVSAFTDDALVQKATPLGVKEVLLKPVSPSTLFDAVCEALGEGTGRLPVRRAPDGNSLRYPALAGKKVLLVDDNDLNREVAQSFLTKAGIQVLVAKDGQDALDRLANRDVDLVLMDCQMPIMDGYEATRRLRQSPKWQDLPVVAMTANVMDSDKNLCLAAGMNDHIGKPLDVPVMFEVIARWLGVEAEVEAPATPVAAPDWPQHPQLNVSEGLRRVMNDAGLYTKVLSRFAGQAPAMLTSTDPQSDLRQLHTLKGLLGSLGANALAETARQLEGRARGGEPTAPLLASLNEEMAGLLAAIDAWLPEAPPHAMLVALEDHIKARLGALRPALQAADASALDELEQLLAEQPELGATLSELRARLERFDFDLALAELDTLLEVA